MLKSALSHFTEAICAYHAQSFDAALQLTQKAAAAEPKSLFYQQAVRFLKDVAAQKSSDVYASPAGFEAFIRGGGNIPLYANTSAILGRIYAQNGPATLLDIGVGDGHALLPALSSAITHLDLVEPSAAMLTTLSKKLNMYDLQYQLHPMTWQNFQNDIEPGRYWNIIQMTFSAHAFAPHQRPELLRWCAKKADQLLIVEFDVPQFADMLDTDVVAYHVAKYELGLAEYSGQEIVMQRFLMPVFFGNFAHDSQRLTFEQPADAWQADLKQAGFLNMQKIPIFSYWWGPAFLIHATTSGTAANIQEVA